jgi:trimeric autotransporter adhesin
MKRFFVFLAIACSNTLVAQNITNTLATGGIFSIINGANTYFTVKQSTGLIGIGTNATDPRAQLEIGGTEGLLVRGTVNSGTIRALGAGLRLHWYPRKGAFRVGNAESSYWDDDGTANPKMSLYSIAMGYQPRASAVASTAIGAYNQATGDYSLSLGSYSQATQSHAVAIGTQAYATGIYSMALGSGANTNGKDGSFVFGDDAYFQTAYSSADNQLTMRFIGGYRLWSSYPDSTAGVYMRHGQSGWSNYCDRNMKENFKELDGEEVLDKLHNIPVTEWNYRMTDPAMRYVGPVAQDFYAAFHLGGTDSLGINTISIDGVNMAGVKALDTRTREMKKVLTTIQEQNTALMEENKKLKEQLADLKDVSEQVTELKQLKAEMVEQLKIIKAKNAVEVSSK